MFSLNERQLGKHSGVGEWILYGKLNLINITCSVAEFILLRIKTKNFFLSIEHAIEQNKFVVSRHILKITPFCQILLLIVKITVFFAVESGNKAIESS